MNRVVVTRAILGICHMQVCAVKDAADEEILAACNRHNPAGTSNGWTRVHRQGDETKEPVECEEDDNRLHILVSC